VDLGQLAAHHRLAVLAVRGRELGQRHRQPAAGLEVDLGAAVRGQFGEAPLALARAPGREPLETEPVGGQPRNGQCGRHRGRAGQRRDPDAGRRRGGHQPVARIADPGCARVGHQQHVLAGLQIAQQARGPARLDRVVVGDDARLQLDLQAGREPAHPPGVLGRDDRGPDQLGRQPRRGVVGPADRHRGQREHPGLLLVTFRHGGILYYCRPAGRT